MSRISLSEILKILQLSHSPYGQKLIAQDDFSSSQSLLTVIHNDYKEEYNHILQNSTFINGDKNISLWKTELSTLLKREPYTIYSSSISLEDNTTLIKADTIIIFKDYSDQPDVGMNGDKGAFYSKKGRAKLLDTQITSNTSQNVELSYWNKILDDKSNVPYFEVILYDENDKIVHQDGFRDFDLKSTQVYDHWVRYKMAYEITPEVSRIEVWVNGKHQYIDKLLIKSKGIHVHQHLDEDDTYANHMMVSLQE